MSYDPLSSDSMFSRVMERLDNQDETLKLILAEVKRTNGRVASLERSRTEGQVRITMLASIVSGAVAVFAWFISVLYKHADK